MAKSVTTHGTGDARRRALTLPQWCGVVGSQFAVTGMQMSAYDNKNDTHQTNTIAARILRTLRNGGVMKT